MIARIWHGYTTVENADVYEQLLKTEIFTEIDKKDLWGYKGIKLLRRSLQDEVEFITIMFFESLDTIKAFAGDEYETAYVPAKARKILKRFDDRSQHYEIRQELDYPPV
jgi:heme-degrading monooxygenase HmoA